MIVSKTYASCRHFSLAAQFFDHDGLWIVAIGLVVIQTIGGVFVFQGFGGIEPLEASPWLLLRKRWIAFSLFCGMDVAVAVLAGLGGAEFSPDTIGWGLPALISGFVALVVPWVSALALHYLAENGAEILGSATAACGVVVTFVGGASLLGVWTGICLAAVAVVAVIFVFGCIVGGATGFFIWTAVVFGEAVRELYKKLIADRRTAGHDESRWQPALAATTIGVCFVSAIVYALIKS